MTKKSNSFTIRLGYNLFWFQKKSTFFIFFRFRHLLTILKKELYKYSFIFLSLTSTLSAFIVILSVSFRKLKYFKKISTIVFFNVNFKSYNYLNFFYLKFKCHNNKIKLSCSTVYNYNFIYRFKYLEMFHFLINFFWKCMLHFSTYYNIFYFIHSFNLCKELKKDWNYILLKNYLIKVWIKKRKRYYFSFKYSNLVYWFNCLNVFRSRNVLCRFKLFKVLLFKKLEIFFETLFVIYYRIILNLYLVNILNTLNKLYLYKKKELYKVKEFKKEMIFYYIVFYLKSAEFLCKYIGSVLVKNKYHLKNLRYYLNNIYKLYFIRLINFYGLKLYLNGKLNGKMRKQKYFYKIGKVLLNTFKTKLQFYFLPLYTKYGIFSIKVWLSY